MQSKCDKNVIKVGTTKIDIWSRLDQIKIWKFLLGINFEDNISGHNIFYSLSLTISHMEIKLAD